jgi:hypothetical protein
VRVCVCDDEMEEMKEVRETKGREGMDVRGWSMKGGKVLNLNLCVIISIIDEGLIVSYLVI